MLYRYGVNLSTLWLILKFSMRMMKWMRLAEVHQSLRRIKIWREKNIKQSRFCLLEILSSEYPNWIVLWTKAQKRCEFQTFFEHLFLFLFLLILWSCTSIQKYEYRIETKLLFNPIEIWMEEFGSLPLLAIRPSKYSSSNCGEKGANERLKLWTVKNSMKILKFAIFDKFLLSVKYCKNRRHNCLL